MENVSSEIVFLPYHDRIASTATAVVHKFNVVII